MSTITVSIVDDHHLFRDGIRLILQTIEEVDFQFEAHDADSLLQNLERVQPDVLLLDLELPDMNGQKLLPIIRQQYPSVKVIVLTMHAQPRMMTRMIELGAGAYLCKNVHKSVLRKTIQQVYEKGHYYTEEMSLAMANQLRVSATTHSTHYIAAEHGHVTAHADYLYIKKGKALKKVLLKDIIYLEVDERYCDIYTIEEKFVIMISLKKILPQLGSRFYRTHRNHIVNLDHIKEIVPGENLILLSKGHHATLSDKYKSILRESLTLR